MNTTNLLARVVRIALVALSLLAWQLSVALADYDARKSEAMAELDRAQMSPEERASLKEVLGRYFEAREDCLEALVEIIKKQDENEQDALFSGRAAVCASTGSKILSDGLSRIDGPSLEALSFLNVFAMQESAFFQGLTRLTVADARDRIVVTRSRLQTLSAELKKKWQVIVDEDTTLDKRAEDIGREMKSDLEKVFEEVAKAHRDAAEILAEGVKQWAQAETSPDINTGDEVIDGVLSATKFLLGPYIEHMQARSTRWVARANAYKVVFHSERRVVVMFEEVRGDVKRFLEENDFPRAEAAYASAKTSSDTFVSDARTSGQKSDAAEFRKELMQELAGHLQRTADVYGQFVKENQAKFLGAVGPEIERELLEPDTWREFATYVEGYGLDYKLRERQNDAKHYFGVELGRLSSEARERLKKDLRYVIEDIADELTESSRAYRDMIVVIKDQRKEVEKKLD